MNKQNQQRFRLAAFTQLCWPTTDPKNPPVPTTFSQAGAWIESAFWLVLGGEIEAYAQDDISRLLQKSHPLISTTAISYKEQFDQVLPVVQSYDLDSLIAGKPVESHAGLLHGSQELYPYFQTALHSSNQMNRDVLASTFREFLAFAPGKQWAESLEGPCSIDTLNHLLLNRDQPRIRLCAESKIAGFLRTLQMMAAWRDLLKVLRSNKQIELGRRAIAERRIGLITCWSLNFSSHRTKERFSTLQEVSAQVLGEISRAVAPHVAIDISAFKNEATELTSLWERTHPHVLQSTGAV